MCPPTPETCAGSDTRSCGHAPPPLPDGAAHAGAPERHHARDLGVDALPVLPRRGRSDPVPPEIGGPEILPGEPLLLLDHPAERREVVGSPDES